MKNYFKKGIKGDFSFIVGYQKSFAIDEKGESINTIKIYYSDGSYDESEYTTLAEINTLKAMREQFASIDKSKLKGSSLREYEKMAFFLKHEEALNKALFNKAKSAGFYKGQKHVSTKELELMTRFPILEKAFAQSRAFSEEGHFRVVNNAELAERLGVPVEKLESLKSENSNQIMDNFAFLISTDCLEPEEIELGLAHEGFDLLHYSKKDIDSALTGKMTPEEARKLGMIVITKREFAESLHLSERDINYIESLRKNDNIPEVPLITVNDLSNYSLEDLRGILDGTYGQEYNKPVRKSAKAKRFSLTPLKEKLLNMGGEKRPAYY